MFLIIIKFICRLFVNLAITCPAFQKKSEIIMWILETKNTFYSSVILLNLCVRSFPCFPTYRPLLHWRHRAAMLGRSHCLVRACDLHAGTSLTTAFTRNPVSPKWRAQWDYDVMCIRSISTRHLLSDPSIKQWQQISEAVYRHSILVELHVIKVLGFIPVRQNVCYIYLVTSTCIFKWPLAL